MILHHVISSTKKKQTLNFFTIICNPILHIVLKRFVNSQISKKKKKQNIGTKTGYWSCSYKNWLKYSSFHTHLEFSIVIQASLSYSTSRIYLFSFCIDLHQVSQLSHLRKHTPAGLTLLTEQTAAQRQEWQGEWISLALGNSKCKSLWLTRSSPYGSPHPLKLLAGWAVECLLLLLYVVWSGHSDLHFGPWQS